MSRRPAPSRSLWPMPGISSPVSFPSSATGARSSSARWSIAPAQRRDIQLKGSGLTPFSRRGDGRAALGPVLREYLVSEAMHALGVPTTRALAAVSTGEPVYREGRLPGAIVTRVAASHLRVGTFQYFAARRDIDGLKRLADYTIDRHDPAAREDERPYLALLQGVVERQARLIARWMQLGFIHGVMNTDNTALSGETIDFGPCAFMDAYDPATVFSAIDQSWALCLRQSAGDRGMESGAVRGDPAPPDRPEPRPGGRACERGGLGVLRQLRDPLARRHARQARSRTRRGRRSRPRPRAPRSDARRRRRLHPDVPQALRRRRRRGGERRRPRPVREARSL